MQGVFLEEDSHDTHVGIIGRLAANWGDALDPDVDEETQNNFRERQVTFQKQKRTYDIHQSGGAAPAPGAPAPVLPTAVPTPVPPPVRFIVRGVQMYVLKGSDEAGRLKPRPGAWGHYLVPYRIDPATKKAIPFKDQIPDNPTDVPVETGFPGNSSDGKDLQPQPDGLKCKEGRDFVSADAEKFWEVGLYHLRGVLETAEAMDLAFARRMEGLGSVGHSIMWDCIDPDYDPNDREAVINQFMGKYMDRFFSKLDTGNTPSIESVSAEALHKHKVFCKAWTEKHYKTLTPVVTAPAEALASEFYPHLEHHMIPSWGGAKLTRMDLTRLLMRHPEFCTDFASALHYYSGALEQSRGGRNASYKQINMMSAARVTSYKKLGEVLEEKQDVLIEALRTVTSKKEDYYCHPWTVDWYHILGQTPPVHKYFDEPSSYHGSSSRKAWVADSQIPPWMFGRGERD